MQTGSGTTRRRRRTSLHSWRGRSVLAVAITLLLGAAAAVAVPQAAQAMTQTLGGQGYPGDTVTIQVRNDQTGPAFSRWTLSAPAGTTITAVSSANPPNLGQFACSTTTTLATCGPAAGGGWGVGNTVALTLRIDAAATVGAPQGTSRIIGGETGQFAVTVLAPPAPVITAPANGTRTLATQPVVQGTKRAGNSASVSIDGAVACSIPADAAATWTCPPPAALAPGVHTVTATQTSPGGDTSTVSATTTFTVLETASLVVTQAGPRAVVPTVPVSRTISATNSGPGTASASGTFDLGGFPATTCTLTLPTAAGTSDTEVDCGALANLPLGLLAPGSAAVLTVDGTVPAGTAVGTTYTFSASVASENDPASPVTSSVVVGVAAPSAPVITAPISGTTTTERRPSISGGSAVAGATVEVLRAGVAVCTTEADPAGSWSCAPTADLPLGVSGFTARESVGGLASTESGAVVITVLPVVTPPTGGGGGGPGTGGGTGPGPGGGGNGNGNGAGSGGSGGSGTGPGVSGAGSPGSGAPSRGPAGTAEPTTPAPSPAPAPAAPGDGSGAGTGSGSGTGNGTGGAGGTAGGNSSGGAIGMDLRFAQPSMAPGTVSSMRGTLGPNASARTTTIEFAGRVTPGMVYRSVLVTVGTTSIDCQVATTTFSCDVPLRPGQSADVEVRLFADAVNAPDIARQQLAVTADRAAQSNAMTSTITVGSGSTDTEQLADAITTFTITTFPGAFIPLLSMLLLGLAATVVETGRRRRAATATPAPNVAPPSQNPPPDPSGSTS